MESLNFIETLKASRQKVLACVLLDWIGDIFFRRRERNTQYIGSAFVIFLFEIFLLIVVGLIGKAPVISIIVPLLLASLITSIGLLVHTWSFDYSVEMLGPSLGEIVDRSEKAKENIYSWLKNVPGLRLQVFLSFIGAIVAVFLLVTINSSPLAPFPIYIPYFIAIGFSGFSLTQGAFWCLFSPSSINQLYKLNSEELLVSRLNPSQTPCIISMSRVLSNYSADFGITMTLCVLTVIALKPSTNLVTIWGVMLFFFLGYFISSFTFLYSQYLLSVIIRREKDQSIHQLIAELNKYWKKLDVLDKESFENMKNINQLITEIEVTRNTAIDLTSLRSYIGSLIVPILTYLGGNINWVEVIKRVSGLFR